MTTAISLAAPCAFSQAAPRRRLNVAVVLPSGGEELREWLRFVEFFFSELFFPRTEPQKSRHVSGLNGFVATVTYEPTPWVSVAPSVML